MWDISFITHFTYVICVFVGNSEAGPADNRPSSATIGESPPPSIVGGGNLSGQQAETGSTTPRASSSTQPPVDRQAKQLSEQTTTRENDGSNGGGLSWITELVNAVEPTVPTANAEVDNQSDGGGGGLDWVTEVASRVGGSLANPRESKSPMEGQGARRGTASIAEHSPLPNPNNSYGFSSSPTVGPTTNIPAGATGTDDAGATSRLLSSASPSLSPAPTTTPFPAAGVPTTPVTTKEKRPPLAQTPTHLEWKPITDGSANRTWGAPPPDAEDIVAKKKNGNDSGGVNMATKNQQQEQLKSPPKLSRSLVAPADSDPAAAAIAATSSPQLCGGQEDVAMAPGGNPGGGSGIAAAGVPDQQTDPAAGDASLILGGEDARATEATRGVRAQTRVSSENNTPAADAVAVSDTTNLKGEQQADLPSSGEPQNKLPPLQEKVSPARGHGDSSGSSSTRWEILRSSVQRR